MEDITFDPEEDRRKVIMESAGSISHEDCEAIRRAIEEDCNTIWPEEWEKPIYPGDIKASSEEQQPSE